MDAITRIEEFNEALFTGFRNILDHTFIKDNINHKLNAELIFQDIKKLEIDKNKIISKIKNLSEEEWSIDYVRKNLKEFNKIAGISNKFIKKHAVEELKKNDLKEVEWEILKRMMIDYAKYTKQFYDLLKYSQNPDLNREEYLLMIELMNALKKVHEASKSLVDRFEHKKYNKTSYKKFTTIRLPMEHLMLRVYYILFNINNKEKLSKYRKVLSREIIEYTIHKGV